MNGHGRNKCRTCLKSSVNLKSLSAKPKMLKTNKSYMDLLNYVTSLQIDNDHHGKTASGLCCTCCKRIRDLYTFIKQVHKCNKYFANEFDQAEDCISLAQLKENRKKLSVSLRENVYDEEPVIKQEIDMFAQDALHEPKQELDSNASGDLQTTCLSTRATTTAILGGNLIEPEACTMSGNKNENIFSEIAIKQEADHKNEIQEIHPLCVLAESTIDEGESASETDTNDSADFNHSNASESNDPLDNDNRPALVEPPSSQCMDEKMLPVRCDECEKVFENSILLSRHKKDTHLPDELKIQCPNCPVKFSRRYNMYAHMRAFHKTETVRQHQIQPRKLIKTDICPHCQRAYSDKYKLMAHIKSKHGPDSPPKKEKQPPKRYLCTLCGLTCSSQSNLDIHYRRHTGEKPYKCEFCGRAYARLYDVQVHRRIHTGETPFKCTVCEKAFKRSNKLKIHMRTHTNERPYKCTQCEKAFKQSKDLNIHKRTHTGERPYKCNVCQSTFTQSNSLKLHQTKTKHLPVNYVENEFNDTMVANTQGGD